MRKLIEKLLADGSEYLYIVRRCAGKIAIGLKAGAALLQASYNTEDVGRAMHYAALDIDNNVRWYEPEYADKLAADALAIDDGALSVCDVIRMANHARTRVGLPSVSTEAVLAAYIKAKHGGRHE